MGEYRTLGRNALPFDADLGPLDAAKANPHLDRLVVRSRGRIHFVKTRSIDWVEACADYVSLHVGERAWLVRRTMGEMDTRLDSSLFGRVNRSAIVNIDRVPRPGGSIWSASRTAGS